MLSSTICSMLEVWTNGKRFGLQIQNLVSRIIATWINFLYLKFTELPLWPPREQFILTCQSCSISCIPPQVSLITKIKGEQTHSFKKFVF